jgi:transcription elongation factor SPT6
VAPYSVVFADEDKEEWDTGKGLRVMAVAYVPVYSQAAFACMVAPNGNCTHYLRLPHLLKRKHTYREEERLQKVLFTDGMRKKLWGKFVMPTTSHC